MNCTLCILAAGLGSRFKGGIKQLEPFGPNGEIIMDYSIYDALEAGFNKIVFVIRRDIKDAFTFLEAHRQRDLCRIRGLCLQKILREQSHGGTVTLCFVRHLR